MIEKRTSKRGGPVNRRAALKERNGRRRTGTLSLEKEKSARSQEKDSKGACREKRREAAKLLGEKILRRPEGGNSSRSSPKKDMAKSAQPVENEKGRGGAPGHGQVSLKALFQFGRKGWRTKRDGRCPPLPGEKVRDKKLVRRPRKDHRHKKKRKGKLLELQERTFLFTKKRMPRYLPLRREGRAHAKKI